MTIPTITKARARRIINRARVDYCGIGDPRRKSNVHYPVQALLNSVVLGFASRMDTLRQIEFFVKNLPLRLRRRLGFRDRRTPCDTTIYNLIEKIEPEGLRHAVVAQIKQALKSKAVTNDLLPFGVISIDGKGATFDWGMAPNEQCQQHICNNPVAPYWYQFPVRVHLISSSARPCLDQMYLPNTMGEATAFGKLLPRNVEAFPKLFRAVMTDAAYPSEKNAKVVLSANKAYIFALKGNQGRLHKLAISELSTQPVVARTEERYQGAWCIRELRRVACPSQTNFPGAEQFWSVTHRRIDDDAQETPEVRYFVTALGWDELDDAHILKVVRLHWGIENNGNWTMDMIFDDDVRCPCKRGWGPSVVGWLRLLAFNLVAITRIHLPKHDKTQWTPWRLVQQLIVWALMIFGGEISVAS